MFFEFDVITTIISFFEGLQPEGELGSYFLEGGLFAFFLEHVAMVAKEDEVSLVVEGDHSATLELWVLGEESGKEPGDPPADLGVEVVEDEFREVVGNPGVVVDVEGELDVADLEDCGGAVGEVGHDELVDLVLVLAEHKHVGVVLARGELGDLVDGELPARPVVAIHAEDVLDVLKEVEHLPGGPVAGGEQDARGLVAAEVLLELILVLLVVQFLVVVVEDEVVVDFALVFGGEGLELLAVLVLALDLLELLDFELPLLEDLVPPDLVLDLVDVVVEEGLLALGLLGLGVRLALLDGLGVHGLVPLHELIKLMDPDLLVESRTHPRTYMLAKSIESLSDGHLCQPHPERGDSNIFKEPLSLLLCQYDPNPGPRYQNQVLVKHSIVGKPDWLKRGGISNQSIFKANAMRVVDEGQSTIRKVNKKTMLMRRNTKQAPSTISSVPTQVNEKVYNKKEILDQFDAIKGRIERNRRKDEEEVLQKHFEERQKYLRDRKVLEKHEDIEKRWSSFIRNSSRMLKRDESDSQLLDCEEYRRVMEFRKSHEKAREMHQHRDRKFWELSDSRDLPILVCDVRSRDVKGKALVEPVLDNLEMIRKPSYSWQTAFKSFTTKDVMRQRLSQYEDVIHNLDRIQVQPDSLLVNGLSQLDWEMRIVKNNNDNAFFFKKLETQKETSQEKTAEDEQV